MASAKDKGQHFQIEDDYRKIQATFMYRKRSNTCPSYTASFDMLNDTISEYDDDLDDSAFNSGSPSPHKTFTNANASSDRSRAPKNVTLGRANDYRSSTGDSPKTPLKRNNDTSDDSVPNFGHHYNYNQNHFDSGYNSPQSMNSMFPNMTSPLVTPITFLNGLNQLNLPVRPYVNYNGLYSPLYGSLLDRHLHNGSPFDAFSHSDRITEMAKSHRNAATHADARHTWSGTLPTASPNKTPVYSCKVFLGGVPWEMTDHDIKLTFSRFGNVNILRPGQHVRLSRTSQNKDKAGYLYLIFETDKQVKALLSACTHDFSNGGKYYFALNQPRYRPKDVQIIPWNCNDTSYVKSPSARVDANKTVFVGALHGMLTAEGLACILEDLFGGVVYVGIDTDKYKYPIGSGRVTFSTSRGYSKAVLAGFIDVKASRFQKKIQIDPFLEESNCTNCRTNKGPIFCRDTCMRYLCRVCWDILHAPDHMKAHQPIMRNKTKF